MSTRPARQTERRPVRSCDPSLSGEANELLTRELHDAAGADEVDVPRDAPHRAQEAHGGGGHPTLVATLAGNRPVVIVTFLMALVVGVVVALVTETYLAVVGALALHALATLAVTAVAIASRAAPAGGPGSPIEALEWWGIGGLSVLSVAVAVLVGGEMWGLPAIVVALCAGWIVLQVWMIEQRDGVQRLSVDTAAARRRPLPIAALVTAAMIWFLLVAGWIADLL